MSAGRQAGIPDEDMKLVARGDIEETAIPDRRKTADTDLKPALMRGMLVGAIAGVVVAVLVAITYGIPLTKIGIIGGGAFAGAMIGGLGSMLTGSSVQDPIRRQFDAEIKAGNVLVVVDAPIEVLAEADPQLRNAGGLPLPYGVPASAT